MISRYQHTSRWTHPLVRRGEMSEEAEGLVMAKRDPASAPCDAVPSRLAKAGERAERALGRTHTRQTCPVPYSSTIARVRLPLVHIGCVSMCVCVSAHYHLHRGLTTPLRSVLRPRNLTVLEYGWRAHTSQRI